MKITDLNIEYRFNESECNAYVDGKFIGGVDFMDKEDAEMDNVLVIQYAEVRTAYRGIGLYKAILTHASNEMCEEYILSDKRTEEATKFYAKYCDVADYNEDDYNCGSQQEIKIYPEFELNV